MSRAILVFTYMTGPRNNILAALAYYDVLDLPLKAEEILARLISFRHLDQYKDLRCPYIQEVKKEMDQLVLDGVISRSREYYFLFDREYLMPLRLKHEKISKHKWRKVKRAIQWLKLVPYVEAVFASGSLAINNTDELSDLDVLIVTRHGRIWTTRLLVSAMLSVFRVRRRGSDKIAPDRVCLNHYITDKSLKIPFKSIYNAQTYSNLGLVYIRNPGLIEEFKKENDWVQDFVFSWNISGRALIKKGFWEIMAKFGEAVLSGGLGRAFESWAKHLQYQRIARNPLTKQSGGRVIFSDEQLEFHPHSIEAAIIKKYNANLIKLGLPDLAIEKDSGLTQ